MACFAWLTFWASSTHLEIPMTWNSLNVQYHTDEAEKGDTVSMKQYVKRKTIYSNMETKTLIKTLQPDTL